MNSPTTKIAVFGAGSIGCYLGGILKSQNMDVVFIGRDRLKKAVQTKGMTLTHFEAAPLHLPSGSIRVETTPSALKNCDLILLCTKSQDTANAAQEIRKHAKPGSQIVSCQNGVGNVEILNEYLKSGLDNQNFQISGAIIPFNVTPTGPASYHCGTDGALHFEHGLPGDVQDAFKSAGQHAKYGGNFQGDQWAKLLVNLNNALNTLSGGTLREAFLQRDYRLAFAKVIAEGISVAKAKNIEIGKFNGRSPSLLIKMLKLPNFLYKFLMDRIVKIDAKARSSMLDDLELGRPSEIDYLQGEIVREGKTLNLQTPANLNVLRAVQNAFKTGRSPNLSGTEILNLVKERQ
jgi:2-dehydropantoate 2-reductase